jgi:hypothetical protein
MNDHMKQLSPLNVPLIHKIFASQIAKIGDGENLKFHREPSILGIAKQVVMAKVEVENNTVAFQRLAKLHSYDPDGIYAADGLPILYSTTGDANAM